MLLFLFAHCHALCVDFIKKLPRPGYNLIWNHLRPEFVSYFEAGLAHPDLTACPGD